MSDLVRTDRPFYYRVTVDNEAAPTRTCGTDKDLQSILEMYPDAEWEKVYPPAPPRTVDVMHVKVGEEQVLRAQQILEPSDLRPFEP